MFRAAVFGIGLAIVLIAPNALWLERSTVRIENRGSSVVTEIEIEVCSERHGLADLPPGSSVFKVLPKCGEATLAIFSPGSPTCRMYVEAGMYHVRAWFTSPGEGDCEYGGSPPFSPLLVWELL